MRNVIVLTALVIAQLATVRTLESFSGMLIGWSWQSLLSMEAGALFALGACAYLLFTGKAWMRVAWVAASAALPPLIAEAVSWSDAAYPGLNYLLAIAAAMVSSFGALIARALTTKQAANSSSP